MEKVTQATQKIVNYILEKANVPPSLRQQINDECDIFVEQQLLDLLDAPAVITLMPAPKLPDCYKSRNDNHECQAAPHFPCNYPACYCEPIGK